MNQVAIVFGLIIAAVVAVGAFQVMAPLVTNAENRSMEAEVINLIAAARDYVEVNRRIGAGVTAHTDLTQLTTNGYLDSDLYTNGVNQSVIGTNISSNLAINATTRAVTGDLTYNAGDQESCNWLQQRSRTNTWPTRGPGIDPTATTGATAVTCGGTGNVDLTIPIR